MLKVEVAFNIIKDEGTLVENIDRSCSSEL